MNIGAIDMNDSNGGWDVDLVLGRSIQAKTICGIPMMIMRAVLDGGWWWGMEGHMNENPRAKTEASAKSKAEKWAVRFAKENGISPVAGWDKSQVAETKGLA